MPKEYVCKGMKRVTIGDTPAIEISHEMPDGDMHHHIMPEHTLQARAIEYDLDPVADFDQVLDIVLHEPFVDEDDDDDPAVAEGYTTTVKGRKVKATLWTAETIKDAREAHILRVEKAKATHTTVTLPDDVKQQMKDVLVPGHKSVAKKTARGTSSAATTPPVHPALVNLKEMVAHHRRMTRGREDGVPLKGGQHEV